MIFSITGSTAGAAEAEAADEEPETAPAAEAEAADEEAADEP